MADTYITFPRKVDASASATDSDWVRIRVIDNGDGTFSLPFNAVISSDIQIGGVELKNATDDTRAKIAALTALASSDNGMPVAALLLAGSNAIGKLAANSGVDIGDVDPAPHPIACGELQGVTSATQMPSVACTLVRFKAQYTNTGYVYIGGSGVTKRDGATDTTTGLQLGPGDDTGWLTVSNLNVFYRICDAAGDCLTYLVMV